MINPLNIKNEIKSISFNEIDLLLKKFDISRIGNLLRSIHESEKPHANINTIKDGLPITVNDLTDVIQKTINDYKSLKSLGYSMRITNIQLIDLEVKAFTKKFYKDYGVAMTCNMYITPNSQSNCFIYHVDDQVSLITQLHGDKEWHIPEDEHGNCEYYDGLNKQFSQTYEKEKIITIKKGESLLVGQNVLHRVFHAGKDVSIHYTFALTPPNHLDFLRDLISQLDSPLKKNQLSFNYDLSDPSLEETLELFKNEIDHLTSKENIKEFKMKKIKEEFRLLKEGRIYDNNNLG
jgi:ribosomal protein L16 Arg81 hydroxylase